MSASLGQKFREAREAKNLKINDIADQLRFSNSKIVEAIESDNYPQPIDVYWRGYALSYARLLDIPLQEVEKSLEELGYKKIQPIFIEKPETKVSPSRWMQWFKQYWFKVVSVSVIVILTVLILTWYHLHRERYLTSVNIPDANNLAANTSSPTKNQLLEEEVKGSSHNENVPSDQSLMVIKNHYELPNQEQAQEDQNQ